MDESGAETASTPLADLEESSTDKLQQKIDRLTLLLKKAKESILDYTIRIREQELELKSKDEELSAFKSKFSLLSKYKPPKSESITDIITRVKVFDDVYCFVDSQRGHFWLHENQITSKHVLPEVIDSKHNKKYLNDQIASAVQEWKERCSKLGDQISVHEENNENLRKMVQELNKQNENMEKELKLLKSNNVEKVIKTVFALYEDVSEVVVEDNVHSEKINLVIKGINLLNESFNEGEAARAKDSLLVILRYLMDLAKRLISARNELKAQDLAWRTACDSLLKEKEEIKNLLTKIKGESLSRNSEFNEIIEKNKIETEVIIGKLNKELKKKDEELLKSINVGYVKQVLLQYLLSNDPQVQERMLSVLSTLLNFTLEENQKIRERLQGKGMLSKFLYNSS